MQSQVKYNYRRSESNPECLQWWFLIINKNREIKEIQQRIYDLFIPITEEEFSPECAIKKTGLRYKLIIFESKTKIENYKLKKIHKTIRRDTGLYARKNSGRLEKYIIDNLRD